MNYKNLIINLLNKGLIKKQTLDFKQIKNLLLRARKDLVVAKRNLAIDEEVTYNYAYLAMLRCGRALMLLHGYRPDGGGQHKTVIDFVAVVLGPTFADLVNKFDIMRRKRNQFTYEPFLPISRTEAENALKSAEEFVTKLIELVKKENPQLELDL
ncbi:MAG: HEPN domain-containing protein [candidate division WOR-3 bacterium]